MRSLKSKPNLSEDELSGKTVILEDYTGISPGEAEKKLKNSHLSAKMIGTGETVVSQLPAAGEAVPGGSQVLLYLDGSAEETQVTVPDFSGMHRQQASDTALSLGLYILVTGNSEVSPKVTVTAQSVPANTKVPMGTTITLEFTDTTVRD